MIIRFEAGVRPAAVCVWTDVEVDADADADAEERCETTVLIERVVVCREIGAGATLLARMVGARTGPDTGSKLCACCPASPGRTVSVADSAPDINGEVGVRGVGVEVPVLPLALGRSGRCSPGCELGRRTRVRVSCWSLLVVGGGGSTARGAL
jgi:hypothetical protein